MIRVVIADDQALVRAGFSVLVNSAEDLDVVGEAAEVSRPLPSSEIPAQTWS